MSSCISLLVCAHPTHLQILEDIHLLCLLLSTRNPAESNAHGDRLKRMKGKIWLKLLQTLVYRNTIYNLTLWWFHVVSCCFLKWGTPKSTICFSGNQWSGGIPSFRNSQYCGKGFGWTFHHEPAPRHLDLRGGRSQEKVMKGGQSRDGKVFIGGIGDILHLPCSIAPGNIKCLCLVPPRHEAAPIANRSTATWETGKWFLLPPWLSSWSKSSPSSSQ